jgi:hypothetical protein
VSCRPSRATTDDWRLDGERFWRQVGLLAGRYGSGDVGEVVDAGRLAGFELGHLSGVRYLHRYKPQASVRPQYS